VGGDVLVVLVHVVDDEVHQHADAAAVGGDDQLLEGGVAADARVDLAGAHRPVAVVGGDAVIAVVVDAVGVADHRRQPQGAHAEPVEGPVLDGGGDAGQVAAVEVGGRL